MFAMNMYSAFIAINVNVSGNATILNRQVNVETGCNSNYIRDMRVTNIA